MSNITNFNFHGFDVRTIVLPNGEPGFVGKDVAERLGYANPSDAIGRHCKGVIIRYPLSTAGGLQAPTPAPGEWIEWNGGECPIADDVQHEIRMRDGWESSRGADAQIWSGWVHDDSAYDIVAYRVMA